jgi:hypothetical protein
MHHLDLQIHRGIDQRDQFAGVFLLVERNGSLPGGQLGAPFFDLLGQGVECLLSFGQLGLVMTGGNADGFDVSCGHEPAIFKVVREWSAFFTTTDVLQDFAATFNAPNDTMLRKVLGHYGNFRSICDIRPGVANALPLTERHPDN